MSNLNPPSPPKTGGDDIPSSIDPSALNCTPQRIARCIWRFLLMVLYLLFLYTAPSSDFSVSTIATSDDGITRFAALRELLLGGP
jgi:hypothetical protein